MPNLVSHDPEKGRHDCEKSILFRGRNDCDVGDMGEWNDDRVMFACHGQADLSVVR